MHLTPVTPFVSLSAFPAAILAPGFRMYWFEDILLAALRERKLPKLDFAIDPNTKPACFDTKNLG
jgi:hypothetical protein